VTVTREEIERIARLAALAVEPEALPALTRHIAGILDYVSQLEQLDTAGVEPDAGNPSAGPGQGLRPDVARRATLAFPPAELAPAFQDGLFLVPRLGAVGDDSRPEGAA
jgi:aspartyl-tRNA(Asn)/glutamyl-tRNA(Gln) amidotransferase subunit C